MHTFLIKPTNNCNLRCKYCFIDNNVKSTSKEMSIDLAYIIVDKIASFLMESQCLKCEILWHGGEPLIWDIDNYKKIFAYIYDTYPNIEWCQSLQTNLTLLTLQHIELFKKYNVNLSTSIDGYKELHNSTRILSNGVGSFETLYEKLQLVSSNKIRLGVILVLNSKNISSLLNIYNFFKKHNQSFKINPLVKLGESKVNDDLCISVEDYAQAMIRLFDYWIADNNAVPIYNFIEYASSIYTSITSCCSLSENCQEHITTIEPNGDIVACDRLCSQYNYGNIVNQTLSDIIEVKKKDFDQRKIELLRNECKDCEFWEVCKGGCPAESDTIHLNLSGRTIYCEAYKILFKHIKETLKYKSTIKNV